MSDTLTIDVPWWTVPNPQAVGAAAPIPIELPAFGGEPPPALLPGLMPVRGEPVQIPIKGTEPDWSDVFDYTWLRIEGIALPPSPDSQPVTRAEMAKAIAGAVGESQKAMSGFVNTAYEAALETWTWTAQVLSELLTDLPHLYGNLVDDIAQVRATLEAITKLAIPNLQAQLTQQWENTVRAFQYNSAVDRAWATDNIYKPLHENIGQVAEQIPVWANGAYQRANDYTDAKVGALGLATLSSLVPIAQAVSALQQEAEECTKPMCDTMGPKTDLGKLLKGLNIAALVALFASLGATTADDINGIVGQFGAEVLHAITTFDDLFVEGGATLAHTIASAIA